jgi:hypothetical protein
MTREYLQGMTRTGEAVHAIAYPLPQNRRSLCGMRVTNQWGPVQTAPTIQHPFGCDRCNAKLTRGGT